MDIVRIFVAMGAFFWVVSSCGVKGDPQPPEKLPTVGVDQLEEAQEAQEAEEKEKKEK